MKAFSLITFCLWILLKSVSAQSYFEFLAGKESHPYLYTLFAGSATVYSLLNPPQSFTSFDEVQKSAALTNAITRCQPEGEAWSITLDDNDSDFGSQEIILQSKDSQWLISRRASEIQLTRHGFGNSPKQTAFLIQGKTQHKVVLLAENDGYKCQSESTLSDISESGIFTPKEESETDFIQGLEWDKPTKSVTRLTSINDGPESLTEEQKWQRSLWFEAMLEAMFGETPQGSFSVSPEDWKNGWLRPKLVRPTLSNDEILSLFGGSGHRGYGRQAMYNGEQSGQSGSSSGDMKQVTNRESSFPTGEDYRTLYANSSVGALADAGFYHTEQNGQPVIECHSCKYALYSISWKPDYNPILKHAQHYYLECSFIRGKLSNHFSSEASRQATFDKQWPYSSHQELSPSKMAQAGFCFIHTIDREKYPKGDLVICFTCGGKIHNFEDKDTGLGEHINHFPLCKYLGTDDTKRQATFNRREWEKVKTGYEKGETLASKGWRFCHDDHSTRSYSQCLICDSCGTKVMIYTNCSEERETSKFGQDTQLFEACLSHQMNCKYYQKTQSILRNSFLSFGHTNGINNIDLDTLTSSGLYFVPKSSRPLYPSEKNSDLLVCADCQKITLCNNLLSEDEPTFHEDTCHYHYSGDELCQLIQGLRESASTTVNQMPGANSGERSTTSTTVNQMPGANSGERSTTSDSKENKDFELCCICIDKPRSALLIPCGHTYTCLDCANTLKAMGKNCPICREKIKSLHKAFL